MRVDEYKWTKNERRSQFAFLPPSKRGQRYGTLRSGGMAEWTIAAVLKTAGLTAPGVRIPLPPYCEGNGALSDSLFFLHLSAEMLVEGMAVLVVLGEETSFSGALQEQESERTVS